MQVERMNSGLLRKQRQVVGSWLIHTLLASWLFVLTHPCCHDSDVDFFRVESSAADNVPTAEKKSNIYVCSIEKLPTHRVLCTHTTQRPATIVPRRGPTKENEIKIQE